MAKIMQVESPALKPY